MDQQGTVEGRNEDPGRGLGQDEIQDKDQDEAKFEMSVGMDVKKCADNADDTCGKTLPS